MHLEGKMGIANLLEVRYRQYRNEQEAAGYRSVDRHDFASYLGVEYQSLVRWMNGGSEPNWINAKLLAEKLGPEVFIVLGEPPLMPSDPILRDIAESWHELDGDKPAQVRDFMRKLINRQEDDGQQGSSENQMRFA